MPIQSVSFALKKKKKKKKLLKIKKKPRGFESKILYRVGSW